MAALHCPGWPCWGRGSTHRSPPATCSGITQDYLKTNDCRASIPPAQSLLQSSLKGHFFSQRRQWDHLKATTRLDQRLYDSSRGPPPFIQQILADSVLHAKCWGYGIDWDRHSPYASLWCRQATGDSRKKKKSISNQEHLTGRPGRLPRGGDNVLAEFWRINRSPGEEELGRMSLTETKICKGPEKGRRHLMCKEINREVARGPLAGACWGFCPWRVLGRRRIGSYL